MKANCQSPNSLLDSSKPHRASNTSACWARFPVSIEAPVDCQVYMREKSDNYSTQNLQFVTEVKSRYFCKDLLAGSVASKPLKFKCKNVFYFPSHLV